MAAKWLEVRTAAAHNVGLTGGEPSSPLLPLQR